MQATLDYSQFYAKSAAVIMLNDKNETPLIWRDDMPAHCIIGGGLKKDETYLQGLTREILEECSLPRDMFPKMEFRFQLEGYELDTGKVMEHCEIYTLDIGSQPLKLGKEGIGLHYFDYNQLPPMMSYQAEIIEYTKKFQQATEEERLETRIHPVRIGYKNKFQTLENLPREAFYKLDEWNTHANVVTKRMTPPDGKWPLKFDPYPPQLQGIQ